MQKLPEVEEAKSIMNEAVAWSVMKWLREKKNVRKAADRANAALDASIKELKGKWNRDFRAAYDQLASSAAKVENPKTSSDTHAMAMRIKKAEAEAKAARDDAEKTFDDAEKELSTSMAREGCRKAIRSWELHEDVIQLAEAGLAPAKTTH